MSKRNRKSRIRTGTHSFPALGRTEDGKLVVGGVYDFHQCQGMPLDWLFAELKELGIVPDWLDFYKTAIYNGMRHDRIITKIRDPIEDAWGVEFANKVCDTLNEIYNPRKKKCAE
jgi:hypothetical protein